MKAAPMASDDPFHLQRFVQAQAPVYPQVLRELQAGRKASHWMWFIFPQLKSLGRSTTAQHYGLQGLAEALAYQAHPVLGARLLECTTWMLAVQGRSALQVLGSPDDLKFRSCMTLFAQAAPDEAAFQQALQQYFAGQPDARTLELLGAEPASD
jgi:uncharacterized protein (DUF1810 family)